MAKAEQLASEADVHGTSKAIHAGRRTIVVTTELRNDPGKLVALVTQTQAVITNA